MQSRQRLIQNQKNKKDNNQIRKIRVDLGKRSFFGIFNHFNVSNWTNKIQCTVSDTKNLQGEWDVKRLFQE